ncbi:putative type VI secretion system effector [Acinetobacter sp. YH12239]|uniref:putative type VI secretion system effector n=1 Tax=Acinetobacter sp. YH12239 TaxID=2601166 RepID=UPI0015D3B813|nr:putative type VI secretion system effector [Acinetobacter sp. YH12239]
MEELLKIEGRVSDLQIKNSVWSVFGKNTDKIIRTSSFLGVIGENILQASQNIYLATKTKKNVHSYKMQINNHICIGEFQKVLFEDNEYLICIVKKNNDNTFEPYAVLSPKTGLLYMQMEMGTTIKANHSIFIALAKFLLIMLGGLAITLSYMSETSFWSNLLENSIIFLICYIFMLGFFWVLMRTSKPFAVKSEKVFKMYEFDSFKDISLITARYHDKASAITLESVFEYRKVIKNDPYPESYLEDK